MKKLILLLFIAAGLQGFSQDSLPKFTAKILGSSKAQVSWINGYGNQCTQVSVQRSYDSLRFFQTIFSSLSPELPQNGFVDNDYMPQLKIYYRIFYVLNDGRYFFSQSKTAKIIQNSSTKNIEPSNDNITTEMFDLKLIDSITADKKMPVKKIYSIYKRKTTHLAYVIDEPAFFKFRDSINSFTKDTLLQLDNEIIIWNPYTPPPAWKPSLNIFSNTKGNVDLYFKDYKTKKYKVIFYDANNKEIFKLKQISYAKLTLDKANFIKAGWYYFELFENDALIEKNKFYVEADF